MLREEKNVKQIEGEPRRRWFADEFFDLIVWLEDDATVWGFQLCYDKDRKPRALTWTKKNGCRHSGIDDGEHGGALHKASPVLEEDGPFAPGPIGNRLSAAAGDLPPEIGAFVLKKISGSVS